MQPGYLHNLIPDSAPHHPESLQNILNGEVIQSVSYNLKLLGKKEKKNHSFSSIVYATDNSIIVWDKKLLYNSG